MSEQLLVRRPFRIEMAWESMDDRSVSFKPLAGELRFIVWGNCRQPVIVAAFAERDHAELFCAFLRYLQDTKRPLEQVAYLIADLQEIGSI